MPLPGPSRRTASSGEFAVAKSLCAPPHASLNLNNGYAKIHRERRLGREDRQIGRSDRHQEIRQSPSLQHGEIELRNPRSPGSDGARRTGLRRERREVRVRHYPIRACTDHLRGRGEGAQHAARQLPASTDKALWRHAAGVRARLSRRLDGHLRAQPGEDARSGRQGLRGQSGAGEFRGAGPHQHGMVRERDAHVRALSQGRRGPARRRAARTPERTSNSNSSSHSSPRCRPSSPRS